MANQTRIGNEIINNAEVLKANICNYSDVYILVRGDITSVSQNVTQVAFSICATFIKCIKKIDGPTIDDAEDLSLVMLMYNLLEYNWNYSDMTGSLWFYSKDEANNFNNDIANTNNIKFFSCKAKLLRNTEGNGVNRILRNAAIFVSLKYL